jgi:hypothetical protein
MSLKNSTVVLTYDIGGTQTTYGSYEYRERTSSGNILDEDQRLFVLKQPTYSDCFIRVTLGEAFVNHAISDEGRPRREGNNKAYTFWRRMSEAEKIHFHIRKYVQDMNGEHFDYQIQES